MTVWLVWTEQGEYEDWSRDLRGVFPTRDLAEAHAKQLGAEAEVAEESVLELLPEDVPRICWAAHIRPDGTEAEGELGWERGEKYRTWSNEITPALGHTAFWSGEWSGKRDRYVEVNGCDEQAVREEYARLLAQVRHELEAEADARG